MTTYNGFSMEAIESAFAVVQDQSDWKAPINTTVPVEIVDLVVAAIEFYTATVPNAVLVDREKNQYRITSPGYRAGPAGDH